MKISIMAIMAWQRINVSIMAEMRSWRNGGLAYVNVNINDSVSENTMACVLKTHTNVASTIYQPGNDYSSPAIYLSGLSINISVSLIYQ